MISRVGNTGRATNDHLHLEMAASPTDSLGAIVDSLQRFPPYTTNPELWIEPLPNTGIIAGRSSTAAGKPVPTGPGLRHHQARAGGNAVLLSPRPTATRPTPIRLYGEHFAVSDVPIGTYTVGTEIEGRRCSGRSRWRQGKLSWVVFKP